MSIFDTPIPQTKISSQQKLSSLKRLHKLTFLEEFDGASYTQQTHTITWLSKEVESFLNEHLKHFKPTSPLTLHLQDKNDKWMAMSAFQKAIRRNDYNRAIKAVMAMSNSGMSTHVWRRLGVIVMEDIGLANPPLMALVLYLMKNKTVRKPYHHEHLLQYIVKLMCESPKSRDLCDVVVWGFLGEPTMGEVFRALECADDDELVRIAIDCTSPMKNRLGAFWYAHAPKFIPKGFRWEKPIQTPQLFLHIAEELKLPPVLGICIDLGIHNLYEALAYPIPVMWDLMGDELTLRQDYFNEGDAAIIGHVYAATYDKHVRSGKRAMRHFLNKSGASALLSTMGIIQPQAQFTALERAVFYVEGSILHPKLHHQTAAEIYFDVLESKVASNGFKSLKEALMFYKFVQEHLPLLHQLRQDEVSCNEGLFEEYL